MSEDRKPLEEDERWTRQQQTNKKRKQQQLQLDDDDDQDGDKSHADRSGGRPSGAHEREHELEQPANWTANCRQQQQVGHSGGGGPHKHHQQQLIGLSWTTRLTIILVGSSLLFSLFFGLEFLVAKVASIWLLAADGGAGGAQLAAAPPAGPTTLVGGGRGLQSGGTLGGGGGGEATGASGASRTGGGGGGGVCLAPKSPVRWSSFAANATSISFIHAESRKPSIARQQVEVEVEVGAEQRPRSKLGLDFELIYEEAHSSRRRRRLPAPPELKLRRLLEAYHLAMPFDPDIWLHSDPRGQMHLLSGEPRLCLAQLDSLSRSIKRMTAAAAAADQSNSSGSDWISPTARRQLLHWLDSMGRPEAGSLRAHPFWLGAYEQCLQLGELELPAQPGAGSDDARHSGPPGRTTTVRIRPRYCVGKLALRSWLEESHQRRRRSSEPGPRAQLAASSISLKVGLCLPEQCDSLALFGQLDAPKSRLIGAKVRELMLASFGGPSAGWLVYPSDQLELVDVYCLPQRERRSLGPLAWLLVALLAAWLCLVLACTWLRSRPGGDGGGGKLGALAEMLAIDANLSLFLELSSVEQSEARRGPARGRIVNLDVLDSVKHLGCAGVIGAHCLLTYLTLGTAYAHTIEVVGQDMRTMLLLSLNNVVDTFFVISGLLVAYLTFKKMPVGRGSTSTTSTSATSATAGPGAFARQYCAIVLGRYLRMAPLYLLVYAFAKLLSVHLGEGPLWDYATNSQSLRGLCRRESWWWPLTFTSNFKPLTEHCVPPAWSLAVDLQFFLVWPLFAWLLRGPRARWGLAGLVALVVASTLCTINDYKSLLDYVSLADFAKLRLHVFTVLIRHAANAYSQPQNRMGPLLVGLIGGYCLHRYERERELELAEPKPARVQWPRCMRGPWLRLALLASLAFVLAPCLVQVRERARAQLRAHAAAEAAAAAASSAAGTGTEPNLPLQLRLLRWLLALDTSDQFDCYLAMGAFILIKPLWSLCNCVVFLRLVTDLNGGPVARLMALPVWRCLSKLNYAILLVHFELIAYESMSRLAVQQPLTWVELAGKFAFAYLGSLLLAGPLYVLVEQPLHRLTSAWLRGPASRGADKEAAAAAAVAVEAAGQEEEEAAGEEEAPRSGT